MSDSLISAMRRCGASLAETSARQAEAAGGPFYGTVAGKSGAKLKVNAKGASLLLPMTTACASAERWATVHHRDDRAAGDRDGILAK